MRELVREFQSWGTTPTDRQSCVEIIVDIFTSNIGSTAGLEAGGGLKFHAEYADACLTALECRTALECDSASGTCQPSPQKSGQPCQSNMDCPSYACGDDGLCAGRCDGR